MHVRNNIRRITCPARQSLKISKTHNALLQNNLVCGKIANISETTHPYQDLIIVRIGHSMFSEFFDSK